MIRSLYISPNTTKTYIAAYFCVPTLLRNANGAAPLLRRRGSLLSEGRTIAGSHQRAAAVLHQPHTAGSWQNLKRLFASLVA
ncbi:hypothetical protein NPIL_555981, partial [Nephila pilipes]